MGGGLDWPLKNASKHNPYLFYQCRCDFEKVHGNILCEYRINTFILPVTNFITMPYQHLLSNNKGWILLLLT